MLDYYHILHVPRAASQAEIKRAYKQLALKYHPDRNPGIDAYEELFKQINEAHRVLGNPELRRQYDLRFIYQHQTSYRPTYHRPPATEKRNVYNRYGKYDWRKAPKYKSAPYYRIDRNYYRDVAIAFAILILIGVLTVSGSRYKEHLDEQDKIAQELRFDQYLKAAQNFYDHHEYHKALHMLSELSMNYPLESRFYSKHNDMVEQLNKNAINKYRHKDYQAALMDFEILKGYQSPPRLSNWRLMADCYVQLKDYTNAIRVNEYLLKHDSNDLDLLLTLADLYENVGNEEKVLDYYNAARLTFKEYQELSYGAAYEFVIQPADIPEHYFKMFKKRAELLLKKGDFQQAIKDCNWGIFLRPNRPYLYYVRAQAKYSAGMNERACYDLERAIKRGFTKDQIKITIPCGNI